MKQVFTIFFIVFIAAFTIALCISTRSDKRNEFCASDSYRVSAGNNIEPGREELLVLRHHQNILPIYLSGKDDFLINRFPGIFTSINPLNINKSISTFRIAGSSVFIA